MTAPSKVAVTGNQFTFLGFLNAQNFLIGGASTAPASGNSSGMLRITGIKEVPITVPDSDIIQNTGDDGLIAEFDFDSIATRRYIITYAVEDLDHLAKLLGVNVVTIAGAKMVLFDSNNPPIFNVCMIHQSRAVSQDVATSGAAAWQGYIVPIAQARPLGRDGMSERSPGTFRMSVTIQLATKHAWGVTFSEAVEGNTTARAIPVHGDYPLHMQAYTGDGSTDPIDVDFAPAGASLAAIITNTGASIAIASVSAANKTITPAATVTLPAVVIYQFQS